MTATASKPSSVVIRPIAPEDNPALQAMILQIVREFGCVSQGYAVNPDALANVYESYEQPRSAYYIIEHPDTGKILGGGGYGPLRGAPEVCEIQKMYFLPELRGQGVGAALFETLLNEARDLGYTTFYLETVPQMAGAVKFYEKFGFRQVSQRLGNTGYDICSVFMQKEL